MKLASLVLAAGLAALSACATTPASDNTLQETASLMVSIGQHGEGADIAESTAELDARIAAAPNDPYVLRLAAISRVSLADNSQDRAERVKLRHDALAQFDRAISLSKPTDPPRTVMINGQPVDVDFRDLADIRASLFHTVQTDR